MHGLAADKGSSKTHDLLRISPLLLRYVTHMIAHNFYVVKCCRVAISDKQLAFIHRI